MLEQNIRTAEAATQGRVFRPANPHEESSCWQRLRIRGCLVALCEKCMDTVGEPLYFLLCLCVAFPTANIAIESSLDDHDGEYMEVNSRSDYSDLYFASNRLQRVGAIMIGLFALVAVWLVAQKFLADAVKRVGKYFSELSCRYPSYKTFNLVLSMMTGLIFGALGTIGLAFMGTSGRVIGFITNFLKFFATRFDALENLESEKLKKLFYNPERGWFAFCVGMLLGIGVLIPVVSCYAPYGVMGLEILLSPFVNVDIGASDTYQNPLSWCIGLFSASATAMFFFMNAVTSPQLYAEFAENAVDFYRHHFHCGGLMFSCGVILMFLVMAMCVAISWRIPAQLLVNMGALSYWGQYDQWIATGVMGATGLVYFNLLMRLYLMDIFTEVMEDFRSTTTMSDSDYQLLEEGDSGAESSPNPDEGSRGSLQSPVSFYRDVNQGGEEGRLSAEFA